MKNIAIKLTYFLCAALVHRKKARFLSKRQSTFYQSGTFAQRLYLEIVFSSKDFGIAIEED